MNNNTGIVQATINLFTFAAWFGAFLLFAFYLFVHLDESVHRALWKAGLNKIILCDKEYYGSKEFPVLIPDIGFFAPLLWVTLKYSFVFFLFLAFNRCVPNFLDPDADPDGFVLLKGERSALHVSLPMHACTAVWSFIRMFFVLCVYYGIIGLLNAGTKPPSDCPTALTRELFAISIFLHEFGEIIHKKTGTWLTPFFPKRFGSWLNLLAALDYLVPGRAIEFLRFFPAFYMIWMWKIGIHRERHAGFLFYSYLPPTEKDGEFYEAYQNYVREHSIVFCVKEYLRNKINKDKQNVC